MGTRSLGKFCREIAFAAVALGFATQGSAQEFPSWATNWADSGRPALFQGAGAGAAAWDQKIRERGWIERDGNLWHLWYTGYVDNPDKTQPPQRRMLGHATSTDGIHWTRDPANPIHTEHWVEDMCIVRDGPLLRMFAEGDGDIAHQLTSDDGGQTWAELGPLDIRKLDGTPIDPGPRGTPTVLVDNGRWNLFYERGDLGVWLAVSEDPDRLIWTNLNDDPVLARGPDAYDKEAVAINQIIPRDGWFYAFYHANAERPWGDWTTCVARSRDLLHWEKFAGNPILRGNRSSGLVIDPDGEAGPLPPWLYTMHPDVRLHLPPAPSPGKTLPINSP